MRTADVAATTAPTGMIALSFALSLMLDLVLIVAYVAVLKYMAEKPEHVPQPEALEHAEERAAALVGAKAS